MKRREFLALGAAGILAPAWSRRAGAIPLLEHVDRPQQLGSPTAIFDRPITPTELFFVRSHFGPPALDRRRRLHVEGRRRALDLTVDDLRTFPEVTLTAVLQCAGNGRALHRPRVPGVQWVHGAMGQATWTGVRLADLLERAGVPSEARFVRLAGADLPPLPTVPRFIRGIPLARALDPTTLVAYRMNGAPLTLAHGAPLRLVVPGWAGDHWVKWLTHVRAQPEEAEGFFMQTGYRVPRQPVPPGTALRPSETVPVTVLPIKSVIARPGDGAQLRLGRNEVVGVALSGEAAVARVEVSLDGGRSWQPARIEGEPGAGRWQVFRHPFDATRPGPGRAVARAVDAHGNAQPQRAAWNPSGYLWNAWHHVDFTVAG